MKKLFTLILLLAALIVCAQTTSYSKPISVKITKEPAILSIVEGSVDFVDKSGNRAIDANEMCNIRFKVSNTGKGDGVGCRLEVSAKGATSGLKYESKELPVLQAGTTQLLEIPISSDMSTMDGQVEFSFRIIEPQGFDTEEKQLNIKTLAYVPPLIEVVDYAVTTPGGGNLVKKKEFTLQLLLQNTKYGKGENVHVKVELPNEVTVLSGAEDTIIGTLDGGQGVSLEYSLIVTNRYMATEIPIKVLVSEKNKRYAKDRSIRLHLDQPLASSKLNVEARVQEQKEIRIAQLGSEVDKNIPQGTGLQNENTFVLIIANENYRNVAPVRFAMHDGEVFKEYCQKTLGINPDHIQFVRDATEGMMKQEIDLLTRRVDAYKNENPQVIFYYAGHGVPDDASKSSFLLPIDGQDSRSGYKLDDLYARLGGLPASRIMVFLDACFSGSNRDEGMQIAARGVALDAKPGEPKGNMVVFSAAQGSETAWPLDAEGHGLFTFYLLKRLQETQGDTSLEDLSTYVVDNVHKTSLVKNRREQTPSLSASPAVGVSWKEWKLK